MLQNRIYRGEIVHKEQSHPGKHPPIIDQPLWDEIQAQLACNAAQRNEGGKTGSRASSPACCLMATGTG